MEETLYHTSVVIEIVAKNKQRIRGYVSILTVIEYPPSLSYASKILYPEKKIIISRLNGKPYYVEKGNPIPVVDLIIAAQAYNKNLALVTRDKHFETLKREAAIGLKLVLEE